MITAEPSWNLYTGIGAYQQPPDRSGLRVNRDLLSGTLDEVRAEALAAHTAASALRAELEHVELYERVDAIYRDIAEYVDMLECTDWPGGMMLDIIPDGINPGMSKESDTIDGILWRLTDGGYMDDQAPDIAIGPDRRLYKAWMWGVDHKAKTYSHISYAPLDLYDKRNSSQVDTTRTAIDNLTLPIESTLETPPTGALERCGTTPPADLDTIREQAMAAYEATRQAKKWAEVKPTIEQIDAIYADATLLASLLREAGWPGLEKCDILPDGIDNKGSQRDQLIPAVLLPLNHNTQTFLEGTPDYMLGPEGRIYTIWANGYDKVTRTASYHYYAPLDLYNNDHSRWVGEVTEALRSATTAMH